MSKVFSCKVVDEESEALIIRSSDVKLMESAERKEGDTIDKVSESLEDINTEQNSEMGIYMLANRFQAHNEKK